MLTGSPDSPISLAEKRRQLETALGPLQRGQARLAWLVGQAKSRPALDEALKDEAHQVEGCLSKLWVVAESRGDRCYFAADSDSLIVKAVAGLLCDFYSGQPAAEIVAFDPAFLKELGISQHLTPNRRNGLAKVWERIQSFASGRLVPSAAGETPPGV